MEAEERDQQDICRVCRCEGSPDRPLFHPCICTGSIKFIHQECLLQWLRYSKKEFCELCNHRFSFTPIYSPDMPKRLPLSIVFSGFLGTVAHAVRFWLHYTVVAIAWLGVVPLTACRIYRSLFTGSVSSILSLPITVFTTESITTDILQGCVVVALALLAFIGLVWLREQIIHGGGPEWLDVAVPGGGLEPQLPADPQPHNNPIPQQQPVIPANPVVNGNPGLDGDAAGQDNPEDGLPQEPEAPPPVPENPAAAGPENNGVGLGNVNNGQNDDGQWNPMEWDRAADELTWERLLGLDGSLVFLGHVFWVVSLNTLFIVVFAFSPYHIGHFVIMGFKVNKWIDGAHFEGMLTTLCGYCVIGATLVVLHKVTSLLRFRKSCRIFGLCYVVVKVSLLLVIEIIAFPVICGWWLDICSLSLFDATLKDRQASYNQSPMASIFMHWLVGMVYVFYFASFVILLREVLRPGVLWFLRNLNDPDFNPIQEMIHLSIARHLRRFCASLVMFGTSIMVMLYLPSRIVKHFVPSFLPYQTSQSSDSQVDELALELLLLLVILPAVQDQNHTREWLKQVIKGWCSAAAWILNLRSYLFGDVPLENDNRAEPEVEEAAAADEDNPGLAEQNDAGGGDGPAPAAVENVAANGANNNNEGLGAVHQALLLREGPTGFQPFNKPKFFALRIAGLLMLMLLSWLVSSLILMLFPVWFGRKAFSIFFSTGETRVYELYTSATGIYTCILLIRGMTLLTGWIQQGWAQMSEKVKEWTIILAKASIAMVLLVGVIPLMFGLLLEVVVLMPVRVSVNQSPIFFLWQDWALGAMYTKITVALAFMGPDWWLKRAVEQLYLDGVRNINLAFLIPQLVVPAVSVLGISLAVPYVIGHSLAPLVITDNADLLTMVQRRIYPFLLLLIVAVALVSMQLKQFRKLYEHIKNDRYLVGRRLVNYNHQNKNKSGSSGTSTPTETPAAIAANG